MKRTIKLIRFHNHQIALVIQQQIGAVVIRNPAQKRIRTNMRPLQYMRQHRARGSLPVRTCHAQSAR